MSFADSGEAEMIDPVRTDMNCTDCGKSFIATLDFGVDGQHVVECPHCAHEHCRVIEKGQVTGDRWESRNENHLPRVEVEKRCVWKSQTIPAVTSTAAAYIRDRWLNRSDLQ
jgi:DNA-directed RNA polymerase subunit RPC12/RpoP